MEQNQNSNGNKDTLKNFQIVVIEDDEGIGKLIQTKLKRLGYDSKLAQTGADALKIVTGAKNEILIVDYKLPDMSGKELIEQLIKKHNLTPNFFTLTGYGNEQIAAEMMKLGSHEYIVKEPRFLDVLPEVLEHVCKHVHNEQQLATTRKSLQKNLELLKETGEMARVGGWEINLKTNKVYWSDTTKKIHEVPHDYIPKLEEAINFFPGESKVQMEKAVEKAIREGKEYNLELEFVTARGKKLWVHSIGKPEMKNGKCVSLQGTFQDITERKKAENKLTINNAVLKRTEEIAHVGSWDWDVASDTVTWSEELFRIFKLDPKKGAPSYADHPKIYTPESMKMLDEAVKECIKTGESYELDLEIIRGDGKHIYCTASGFSKKDENGKVVLLFGSFQEITKRKESELKLKAAYQQLQASEQQLSAANQQLISSEQQLKASNQQLQANEQQLKAANQQLIASEKELRKSEERFRNITENARDMIYRMSIPDGNYMYVSPASLQIFGYRPDEFYDNPLLIQKIIHPEWHDYFNKEWEKVISGKASDSYEYQIIHKSGEVRWVNQRNVFEKNNEGKISAIEGIVTDITEQKTLEIELKSANQQLSANEQQLKAANQQLGAMNQQLAAGEQQLKATNQQLIEKEDEILKSKEKAERYLSIAAEIILSLDKKGNITLLNESGHQLLGYRNQELIGKNWFNTCLPKTDAKEIKSVFKQIMAGNLENVDNYESNIITKSGDVHTILWHNNTVKDENGNITGTLSSGEDITESKKARDLLAASERKYRSIMDNSSSSIFIKDLDGKYIYINQKFEEMHEISNDEVQALTDFDLFDDELAEQFRKNDQEIIRTGKSINFEEEAPWKGEMKTVLSTKFPLRDKHGKIYAISGIATDITERKKSEVEIRLAKEKIEINEERFRKAQEAGHIGSWEFDLQMEEFWGSDEGKRIYNLDFDEKDFPAEEVMNLVAEKDREKVNQAMIDLVNENKPYDIIFEITPKGTSDKKIIRSIAELQRDKKGNPLKVTGILHDITLQKALEQKITEAKEKAEESEANIKAIIEGTSNSIWAFNNNYEILYVNHTFQQEFLQSFGVLLKPGMNLTKSLPKSLQSVWKNRYDRVLANEQYAFEDAVPTEKGTIYIQVTFNPIVKNGQVIGGSCFGKDITSSKLKEKEIIEAKKEAEESEKKLLEAQEISHVGSWEYFVDTDIVTWSKELYNIFERSYDLPAPIFSEQRPFYTKESFALLEKAIQDCVQHNIPYDIQLDIITSSGFIKHIISKGNVKKDENNKTIGAYGTAQDITLQKKLQLEIIEAKEKAEEADMLKSAFLANMSHEIRTPMNGILGFTDLLQTPGLSGEQRQKFISIIQKSGNRMLETVNALIDISKIETGQVEVSMESVDINSVLMLHYSFFKPEANKKGLDLTVESQLDNKYSIINTDRQKLDSIFTNLIKNAIKYTDKGFIKTGLERIDGYLRFYIKDSGIGVPENRRKAIFNRFEQADIKDTRAFQGSGLGLAIIKAYVEMLGGKIWAESVEGKGSTFYFTLPFEEQATEKKQEMKEIKSAPAKQMSPNRKLNILIVEDDITTVSFLKVVLSERNATLLFAENGQDAVEMVKNHPEIDSIIMDIKLPVMDGYEATRKIREFNKEVKIIAQTAYALEGDREKAIEAGCDDYISKPINKNLLLKMLDQKKE